MSTSVKISLIFMLIGVMCSPIIFSTIILAIHRITWKLLEKYVFEPEEKELNKKLRKFEIGDIVKITERSSHLYQKVAVVKRKHGDWYDVKIDNDKEDFINGRSLEKIL